MRLYEDAHPPLCYGEFRACWSFYATHALVRGCHTPFCSGARFTSLMRLYEDATRHFVTECFGPVGKTENMRLTD